MKAKTETKLVKSGLILGMVCLAVIIILLFIPLLRFIDEVIGGLIKIPLEPE